MKLLIIYLMVFVMGFAMTPDEILKAVDYNMTPPSVSYKGEMNIFHRGRKKTKKFEMYAIGSEKSSILCYYPKRNKGTRFLKNGTNMWIYMPRTDKTIKISDHMLKHSMMGSDFSYDDQTDRNKYHLIYDATLLEETPTEYKLELIRKEGIKAKYKKQIVWIDKETLTLKKAELYATSGKLLKDLVVDETKKIGDRYYIIKLRMINKLKSKSYTELILTDIKIDPVIDESVFSL